MYIYIYVHLCASMSNIVDRICPYFFLEFGGHTLEKQSSLLMPKWPFFLRRIYFLLPAFIFHFNCYAMSFCGQATLFYKYSR